MDYLSQDGRCSWNFLHGMSYLYAKEYDSYFLFLEVLDVMKDSEVQAFDVTSQGLI